MTGSKEIIEDMQQEQSNEPMYSTNSVIVGNVRPVELTKAAMEGNAEVIANYVRDGHANPLDVSLKLKWIAETCEAARKLLIEDCVKEMDSYQGKTERLGVKVEVAETGTKYKYDTCGDTTWLRLDQKASSVEQEKKEREKFLKSLTKPMTIADEDTGEMITINPPVKLSTTNIKVSFK